MPDCRTCLHGATHTKCDGCLTPELPDGRFAYRHYVKGDPIPELIRMQRSGERNIVLGGEGEHEVNVNWTIDVAQAELANVCEHCGGLCWREKPDTIIVDKPYGPAFLLIYEDEKLRRIFKKVRKDLPPIHWWTSTSTNGIRKSKDREHHRVRT